MQVQKVERCDCTFSEAHVTILVVHEVLLRRVWTVELVVGVHGGGRGSHGRNWEWGFQESSWVCSLLWPLWRKWSRVDVRGFTFPRGGRRCDERNGLASPADETGQPGLW